MMSTPKRGSDFMNDESEAMPLTYAVRLELPSLSGQQMTLSSPDIPDLEVHLLPLHGYLYLERCIDGTATEHALLRAHPPEVQMLPVKIMNDLCVEGLLLAGKLGVLELRPFVREDDPDPQSASIKVQPAEPVTSMNAAALALYQLQFAEVPAGEDPVLLQQLKIRNGFLEKNLRRERAKRVVLVRVFVMLSVAGTLSGFLAVSGLRLIDRQAKTIAALTEQVADLRAQLGLDDPARTLPEPLDENGTDLD